MSPSSSSSTALCSTLLYRDDICFGEDKFGNQVVTSEFCNLSMRNSSEQIRGCEQSVEECAGENSLYAKGPAAEQPESHIDPCSVMYFTR